MYNLVTTLLASLNLIEVKGQTNLGLLYNAIDICKQLQVVLKPKIEEEKVNATEDTVK